MKRKTTRVARKKPAQKKNNMKAGKGIKKKEKSRGKKEKPSKKRKLVLEKKKKDILLPVKKSLKSVKSVIKVEKVKATLPPAVSVPKNLGGRPKKYKVREKKPIIPARPQMPTPVQQPLFKKTKSILISLAKPEGEKNPYNDLCEKYKLQVDFVPFIKVEGLSAKEFRKSRVYIQEFSAVIITSRSGADQFFHLCDEMRVKLSAELKYFCQSEAIALYLQKFIQYRKRRVFFADGSIQGMMMTIDKHKDNDRFLVPCSDTHKSDLSDFMKGRKMNFVEAVVYKTSTADLSKLKLANYDMLVFFSPPGFQSLQKYFPKYKQQDQRLGAFGPLTCQAILDAGYRLDVIGPTADSPSMVMALDKYLSKTNVKR